MTNQQYIATLKKELFGLEKDAKNNIIQEIESHASESDSPLIDRFGSPKSLANQYLEGETLKKPISSTVLGISKKLLLALGSIALAIILLCFFLAYTFSKDKFNYANESSPELIENINSWQNTTWTSDLTLNTDQASVILYWHDKNTIRWQCDGQNPTIEGINIKFRQSHCLVYLPKVATTINTNQSSLVLIKPQVSLDLTTHQSNVKIAENGEQYHYEIDKTRAQVDPSLASYNDADLILRFKSIESMISRYEY